MTAALSPQSKTSSIVVDIAHRAKKAASKLAMVDNATRTLAIEKAATAILDNTAKILEASKLDVDSNPHLNSAMVDRLKLDDTRIKAMANGLVQIAKLPDYLGKTLAEFKRPNGLYRRCSRLVRKIWQCGGVASGQRKH